MKRNGFTLVELLAVIAVLGLLIVIVSTKGFGAFNKTKESIDKLEEDNLLEAARTFLVDVDNGLCQEDSEYSDICTKDYYTSEQEVSVGYIKKYYMKSADSCDDDAILILKIEIDEDGNTIGYSAKKKNEVDVICHN